jgi:hypothetical protein
MTEAWTSLSSAGPAKPGGDTYRTLGVRVGKTFARAVVMEARAGNTLYSDALQLLGVRKPETLDTFAERLGVA